MTIHGTGDLIGDRYRVIGFVGQGGMQEVYEADDLLLARRVALKTPKTSSADKRFSRSARTSAKINHANVAKTLDYISGDNHPYLVEELVEGCDLGEFLRDFVPKLDPYLCASAFHHLAKGLAASHHADVVHRDIKPSNIMVVGGQDFFDVKITDFGIAKMAQAELDQAVNGGEEALTQSATALGALPYMAPEMIDDFASTGKPGDVWALGAVAFELLTGSKPFGVGYRAVPLIQAAVTPDLPAAIVAKSQFSGLVREIYAIITRCLHRDPTGRPTADELVTLCETLCYSHSSRQFGIVQQFNYENDGYLMTDEGRRVHFHQQSVPAGRVAVGDRVWFATHTGHPFSRAFPVVPARPRQS